MFDNHQPIISRWSRDNPENMRDTIRFVLLSIRYPLVLAAEDMRANDTRALYGAKLQGWHWLEEHYKQVYSTLEFLWYGFHDPSDTEAYMLEYLASEVPGLGFAKAGFVLQLAYGISGCLDTHNIARYGLAPRQFANVKQMRTRKRRMKNARAYAALVAKLGGTRELWNSWCDYVAGRDVRYSDAFDVSRYHLVAFNLD